MNSTKYEHLIRKAYDCGRFGTAGADFDIFELLKNRHCEVQNGNKEELFNYGISIGAVAVYIDEAILYVLRKKSRKIKKHHKEILIQCRYLLSEPDFDNICKAIEFADKVFDDLKLIA